MQSLRVFKSAGKVVSFSPLEVVYATATLMVAKVSNTSSLVRLSEV